MRRRQIVLTIAVTMRTAIEGVAGGDDHHLVLRQVTEHWVLDVLPGSARHPAPTTGAISRPESAARLRARTSGHSPPTAVRHLGPPRGRCRRGPGEAVCAGGADAATRSVALVFRRVSHVFRKPSDRAVARLSRLSRVSRRPYNAVFRNLAGEGPRGFDLSTLRGVTLSRQLRPPIPRRYGEAAGACVLKGGADHP